MIFAYRQPARIGEGVLEGMKKKGGRTGWRIYFPFTKSRAKGKKKVGKSL